jgi:hypothetical protein
MKLSEQVAALEQENERLTKMVDSMAEELESRPQADPEYVAKLEALLELVAPDIEFKEQHLREGMGRTRAIVEAYRAIRPEREEGKK